MNCNECGSEVNNKYMPYKDANNQPFGMNDMLLWMRPVFEFRVGILTVKSEQPVGYEPVLLVQRRRDWDTVTKEVRIECTEYRSGTYRMFDGFAGESFRELYGLRRGMSEMQVNGL